MYKTGSDHTLMLLTYEFNATSTKKSFKFLKIWFKQESFFDVVKENWKADFSGNLFILFNYRLKKLKKVSSFINIKSVHFHFKEPIFHVELASLALSN